MAHDYQIRPALREAGYSDADIGWDQGRKVVTLKGQDFINKDQLTNVAGSTFTDRQTFDNALRQYNQGQQRNQLQDVVTNYQMPTNPYNQQLDSQIQYLMNYARQNQQPVNAYSTPQYDAYKAQSERRAQEGTRAAQEALGSAGFGRSTVLGERAQGIQNQENEYLETQVIPQIIAAEEARRQQQFSNMSSLLDPLMNQRNYADGRAQTERGNAFDALGMLLGEDQRAIDNRRADQTFEYQQTRDQRRDYESDRLFDYGVYRDNVGDTQWQKQFEQSVKAQAEQMGYNWASLNQRERQMMAEQTARQEQQEYQRSLDRFTQGLQLFNTTGQMPEFMKDFGLSDSQMNNGRVNEAVGVALETLLSEQMDGKSMLARIDLEEKNNLIDKETADALRKTVYSVDPTLSPEKQAEIAMRNKAVATGLKEAWRIARGR